MDPLATWNRLRQALQDSDLEEAQYAASDLSEWHRDGGAMDMLPENARYIFQFYLVLRDLRRSK